MIHQSRFCPRIGFDGKYISMSKVGLNPGEPWSGPGEVLFQSMLSEEIVEFAKLAGPINMVVELFGDGLPVSPGNYPKPSCSILLDGVKPAESGMALTDLDAMGGDIVQVVLSMKYDRLTYIFGDNPLDKIAAVI